MSTELKVVLCGGGGVGKSGLVMRLVTDKFLDEYEPTIEENYNKLLSVDNEVVFLDILDTAGNEQFASMNQQFWFREGEIFILVYTITSSRSFDEISHFARKIATAKRFNLNDDNDKRPKPFIIVGNKCDLESQRQVDKEKGDQLAKQWNAPFFECSCYTQQNLDELWVETVRLSRRILQHDISNNIFNAVQNDEKKNRKSSKAICCGGNGDESDGDNKGEDKGSTKNVTDNIKFMAVNAKQIPPDSLQPPVLALKNFRIRRTFSFQRFVIAIICGIFLPIVIILQTLAFLLYRESNDAWYYPDEYSYNSVHHGILLDYLGLIVGRKPGQDPEEAKDKKWFLRQNYKQKLIRVVLCLLIVLAFVILYHNISQYDNTNVSFMESIGPLSLFCILWILLSGFIAFEPKISPPLPELLLSRLRRIKLIFGEDFTHLTSATTFLRAYAAARNDREFLSPVQYITIILLALLYALTPGITRATVGDDSDNIKDKTFWTAQNWEIEVGAFLVNFLLVATFVFAIEVQYAKHFDNYREWMKDLTLLLSKETLYVDDDEDNMNGTNQKKRKPTTTLRDIQELVQSEKSKDLVPHKFGRDFSKRLFLSLTRRSNAIGWLEIRSFLAIEGKLLFGEQEIPTLFLMVITVALSFFLLYRVFFIDGVAVESILFNGTVILMLVCLISLIRIAITGYEFRKLQEMQQRLLGEQKLWMRCNVAENVNVEIAFSAQLNTQRSIQSNTKPITMKTEENENENEDGKMDSNDEKNEEEVKYNNDDADADDDNEETKPLINDVLNRVDRTNWYQYNFGFFDDILYIVQKKDIYPRLFRVKLNDVLVKAIASVILTTVITIFKVVF